MINKKEIFNSHFPDAHFFDETNLDGLPGFLKNKGWIVEDEQLVSIEKPGEGNMNFVKRIITNKRSFILKQSRPWVEKYPEIEAPVERLEVEVLYYKSIADDQYFSTYSPRVLFHDPKNLIIIFEDLGKGADFTFTYHKSQKIQPYQLNGLIEYISHLHNMDWKNHVSNFPSNLTLRKLNHEHIFHYPYLLENGFDLDSVQPGLQDISLLVKQDENLKASISALGQKYLTTGPVLIHGDYYPGSWLKVGNKVKVIDPEFAYFGYAEFDIAVMVAHLLMSNMAISEIKNALFTYTKRTDFDTGLFSGFCGVEILRRIIGLAQLPLDLSLAEKSKLIKLAVEFIKKPKEHNLL